MAEDNTNDAKSKAPIPISAKLRALIARIEQLDASLTDPEILNIIEELVALAQLTEEENAWLRKKLGLKPKKDPKDKGKPEKKKDLSSEDQRPKEKPPKPANTGRNSLKELEIHETISQEIPEDELPKGSVKIGEEKHRYRGIKIEAHNVEVSLSVYEDPEGKTIKAPFPEGYTEGDFTPELRAELLSLKHECGMTQTALKRFFEGHDVDISSGSISNILLNDGELFIPDRDYLREQALRFFAVQYFDDTGGIVEGKNWHTHILNNPYYAIYDSREKKDRLTLIDVLMGREKEQRKYRFVEQTWDLMKQLRVSGVQIKRVQEEVAKYEGTDLDQKQMEELVGKLYPEEGKLKSVQRKLWDAGALIYYHQQEEVGIPEVVVSDNATQFELVFVIQALCWVHEGRRYKKLSPVCEKHQEQLAKKEAELWAYYKELLEYKKEPEEKKAKELRERFRKIFGEKTGYEGLDKRLASTLANEEELLVVLEHPEVPLHNNLSELGARVKARSRDISLHSRSKRGAKVTDAMMSVVQTARRLGVRARDYILGRIKGQKSKEELFEMVKAKATAC